MMIIAISRIDRAVAAKNTMVQAKLLRITDNNIDSSMSSGSHLCLLGFTDLLPHIEGSRKPMYNSQ
jgi:hypothetical protein